MSPSITERAQMVREFLAAQTEPRSRSDVAAALSLDPSSLQYIFDIGLRDGTVRREGESGEYRYSLAPPGAAPQAPGHRPNARYISPEARARMRAGAARARAVRAAKRHANGVPSPPIVSAPQGVAQYDQPSELDAAIAALEIRRDALNDTIELLKGMRKHR